MERRAVEENGIGKGPSYVNPKQHACAKLPAEFAF
jgi:hypothetical protein